VSAALPLHSDIYNILINNKYNNFTITEFRNELVKCSDIFDDKDLARKFIYRQVNRLINRNLLIKIRESGDKKARFVKTELFSSTSFRKKVPRSDTNDLIFTKIESKTDSSLIILEEEKLELQENLDITLSEVNAYNDLIIRFPDRKRQLTILRSRAKKTLMHLTGKLNAVSNLLR